MEKVRDGSSHLRPHISNVQGLLAGCYCTTKNLCKPHRKDELGKVLRVFRTTSK